MNKKFILKDFKKFFQEEIVNTRLLEEACGPFINDIICIYVTGSTLTNLRREYSDIDVIILVKNLTPTHTIPYRLKYEGRNVHGSFVPFVPQFSFLHNLFFYGEVDSDLLKEDHVLWENRLNHSFMVKFMESLHQRSNLIMYMVLDCYKKEILRLVYNQQYFYKKIWVTLLHWYQRRTNTVDYDLLTRLKNVQETAEDRQYVIDTITKLWEWHTQDEGCLASGIEYIKDMLHFKRTNQ